MFKIRFTVVEIQKNARITHYLHGSRKDVKKDIETFKKAYNSCQMFGNKGMVVFN